MTQRAAIALDVHASRADDDGSRLRILIVRLSAIGDIVHALPVLSALRAARPNAHIGWLVEGLSAPLLDGHPHLDELFVFQKKWRKHWHAGLLSAEARALMARVKAARWDVAIDLQGLFRSGVLMRLSGAAARIGYGDHDAREMSWLFANRRVAPPATARHVVQRNLALLRALHIDAPEARPLIALRDDEKAAMRTRLAEESGVAAGERLLALNPGAGWSSKVWPAGHLARAGADIAHRTGLRPLVLWGPGEEALRDAVADGVRRAGVDPAIAPATRIRELAVLISLCALFIGGDTGPTHIAGALGVPTVSVFGASDGARNRPWPIAAGPMIQRDDLACVPCWKTKCPLAGDAHLACLRGLDPARVADAAVALVSEA